MKHLPYRSAVRVASIYFIFSVIWIFLTDWGLEVMVSEITEYRYYSTMKGIFFVTVSTLIVYLLVRHEMNIVKSAKENLSRVIHTDSLTGLGNRNQFNRDLEDINRLNKHVITMISDVNGLRLINEIYSAQVGDEVLQLYASLLQNIKIPSVSYRIGGDEFCTFFYTDNLSKIEKVAIDLKTKMNQHDDFKIDISVSFGIAVKEEEHSIYQSLSLAEALLTKNKLLKETSSINSLVTSLKTTLFEHSDETEHHAQRITDICVSMAKQINMSQSDLDEIELFAMLHDIGKVGIDDSILRKPDTLNQFEYEKIKRHTTIGYRITKSVPQLESISEYVLTHHERWDGEGYPRGLSKTEIPLASRILAIADSYDAMTNDRVYRKAMSKEKAIAEIKANKGTQFDPELVEVFLQVLQQKKVIQAG